MAELSTDLSEAIPLAPNQKFMIQTARGDGDSGYTNIATAFLIDARHPVSLIARTIEEVVNDNPALCLRIFHDDGGDHRQVLESSISPDTAVFDYTDHSVDDAIGLARLKASELAWRPFSASNPEALRSFVVKMPGSTVVGFVTNHIFSDMISMRALKKQFIARLHHHQAGTTPPAATAPRYTDFASERAAWDRDWRAQPGSEHWADLIGKMDGCSRAYNPPQCSTERRDLPIGLPQEIAATIAAMCRQQETTDFIVVLAIFMISAFHLNSGKPVPVAIARDERPNLNYFRTVGNFAALAPFFVDISPEDTCTDVVRKVKADWAEQSKLKWTPSEVIWRFLTRTQSPFILDYISIEESATANEATSNFYIDRPSRGVVTSPAAADAMRDGAWDNLFFVKKSPDDMFFWSWAGEEFGYSGSPLLRLFDRLAVDLLRHPDRTLRSTCQNLGS